MGCLGETDVKRKKMQVIRLFASEQSRGKMYRIEPPQEVFSARSPAR